MGAETRDSCRDLRLRPGDGQSRVFLPCGRFHGARWCSAARQNSGQFNNMSRNRHGRQADMMLAGWRCWRCRTTAVPKGKSGCSADDAPYMNGQAADKQKLLGIVIRRARADYCVDRCSLAGYQ
jgi:hypothetical protein